MVASRRASIIASFFSACSVIMSVLERINALCQIQDWDSASQVLLSSGLGDADALLVLLEIFSSPSQDPLLSCDALPEIHCNREYISAALKSLIKVRFFLPYPSDANSSVSFRSMAKFWSRWLIAALKILHLLVHPKAQRICVNRRLDPRPGLTSWKP